MSVSFHFEQTAMNLAATLTDRYNRLDARLNSYPWQLQVALFTAVFWVITVMCSVPNGTDIAGLTINQILEDFGVFLLFLGVWAGIYCHFKRNISFLWLILLLAISLWQEEVNLLNKAYQTINLWFDREITSAERQRGDVYTLGFVAVTLAARLIFEKGFRSFFRLHIGLFLICYTTFQGWVHYVFPYHMQYEIMAQRLEYQKEFTSTYPGRFEFMCGQRPIECFEWVGDDIPAEVSSNEHLMDIVRAHKDVSMNTEGYVGSVPLNDAEVFRGVDAAQKYLATYYKNNDLQRVVYDRIYPSQVMKHITRPLLIFATAFGMVWFFLGLGVVFFHQGRVYRIAYGTAAARQSQAPAPATSTVTA